MRTKFQVDLSTFRTDDVVFVVALVLMGLLVYEIYDDEYGFEYDVPLQGLDRNEVTTLDFSVAKSSDRYRLEMYFPAGDGDSVEVQRARVKSCLDYGTFRRRAEGEEDRVDTFGGEPGASWHIVPHKEHTVVLFSRLRLTSDTRYRLSLRLPRFSSRCQTLQPRIILLEREKRWF